MESKSRYKMREGLEKKAFSFFLLAFPGYLIYHFLLGLGLAPAGVGWFTLVLVVACLYFSGHYFLSLGVGKVPTDALLVPIPVLLLVFLMLAYSAIYGALSGYDYVEVSGLLWAVSNAVWFLSLFFIGYNLPFAVTKKGKLICFWGVVCCTGMILYWYDFSSMTFKIAASDGVAVNYRELASYQGLARSVFYFFLFFLVLLESRLLKGFLYGVLVFLLFLIGSRTDFFLSLIIIPFFLMYNYGRGGVLFFLLLVLVGVLIVPFLSIDLGQRYEVIVNPSSDASLTQRSELYASGWRDIQEHYLAGDFLGQVREFGGVGYYIHNFLSAWRQYGITGFLLFCYLNVFCLFISSCLFFRGNRSAIKEFSFYLALSSLLAVLFVKSISWPVPGIVWGVCYRLLREEWVGRRSGQLISVGEHAHSNI